MNSPLRSIRLRYPKYQRAMTLVVLEKRGMFNGLSDSFKRTVDYSLADLAGRVVARLSVRFELERARKNSFRPDTEIIQTDDVPRDDARSYGSRQRRLVPRRMEEKCRGAERLIHFGRPDFRFPPRPGGSSPRIDVWFSRDDIESLGPCRRCSGGPRIRILGCVRHFRVAPRSARDRRSDDATRAAPATSAGPLGGERSSRVGRIGRNGSGTVGTDCRRRIEADFGAKRASPGSGLLAIGTDEES